MENNQNMEDRSIEEQYRTVDKPKSINAIDTASVHRICSGQVVLTLATAVKELIENSLDAGASVVEIKLKEYGSVSIEVSDNGKGVAPSDFKHITMKHHTSKLQDFEDLVGIQTFGFRGEALSSLCALSVLSIITRHSMESTATKLEYDSNGSLSSQSSTSRQKGTSVMVKNIFYSLPVRQKEFHRNLKKEFNKLVHVLYSYCLISTNVRILCYNISSCGKKHVVASTEGLDSIKENISSIFGSKQVASLLEIKQKHPNEDSLMEMGIELKSCKNPQFQFNGLISSCTHGQGRAAADRQFLFINGRPCDLIKVSRVINDTYHSFNKSQFPLIVLNIRMEEENVDINVTPDKRTLLFGCEKLLMASIKTSLISLYEKLPSTFAVQNTKLKSFSEAIRTKSSPARLTNLSQMFSAQESKNRKRTFQVMTEDEEDKIRTETSKIEKSLPLNAEVVPMSSSGTVTLNKEQKIYLNTKRHQTGSSKTEEILDAVTNVKNCESISQLKETPNKPLKEVPNESLKEIPNESLKEIPFPISVPEKRPTTSTALVPDHNWRDREEEKSTDEGVALIDVVDEMEALPERVENLSICVSLDSIKQRLKLRKEQTPLQRRRNFRAKISPSDNKTAEEELQKTISKPMFKEMEIIGQFNLGFIVTRLNSDLFIIDQHASDEKFNFERLELSEQLHTQKLIAPQSLELTPVNEEVLIDNMEAFTRNGFEVSVEPNGPRGRRLALVAIPQSRGWSFGREDVDEMIFMLSDAPGSHCRPSRVRSMLASRACRKSVMIGTALDGGRMRSLVDHMGQIEQPWNCPHGRPTMRHLINIAMINK